MTTPRFDTSDIGRYYDRHTPAFLKFGQGGSAGAIHRAVRGPGTNTRLQAFHYVDDQIAELARSLFSTSDVPHLVDLGCGVGASLCYLAEQLPIRGTGITLSPVQARLAAERIRDAGLSDRVECIEADYCDGWHINTLLDRPHGIPANRLAWMAWRAAKRRDHGMMI